MRVLLLFGITVALLMAGGCTLVVPVSDPPATATPASLDAPNPSTPVTTTAPVTDTLAPTGTVAPTTTVVPTATAPITTTPTVTTTVMPTMTAAPTATIMPTTTVVPTVTTVPTTTATPPATGTPGEPPTPGPTLPPTPTAAPTLPPTPTTAPTNTPTPGPSPTPTPLPSGVFVGSHRSFPEGSNLVVVGEAINGTSAPVYNLAIIATFYDAGNQLVGATESMAFLPQTIPTQRNPFRLQLANAPSSVSRYELTLRWDEVSLATFDRATITREEVNQTSGLLITGDLRNDHRRDLRNLVVVATLYDAGGAVVDVIPGSAGMNTLPPDGTTTFTIQSAQPVTFANHLVQIEGMLLP